MSEDKSCSFEGKLDSAETSNAKLPDHIATATASTDESGKQSVFSRVRDESGEFLNILVHDIRNPLAAIMGWLDLIKIHSNQLDPQLETYITRITESSKQLSILVDTVLDANRIEKNRFTPKLTREDFSSLLYEIVKQFTPMAKDAVITLSYTPLQETIIVNTDRHLFKNIFAILIISSINNSPKGMKISFNTEYLRDKNAVLTTITDYGVTIPAEFQKMIFDKNRLVEMRKLGYSNGLGLGMYFCKLAIEFLKGTISLNSENGQGNIIKIELPVTS